MKLPRDVSGDDLVKALKSLDYLPERQSGSHMRLTTAKGGTHHITIPKHDPLKVGTFAAILDDVAAHHKMTRDDVLRLLRF